MLEELMRYVNNWFLVKRHFDTFTIENNTLSLDFLQDGQYYRIVGSIFNDGVYKYGDATVQFTDETFTGEIWALAVPKAFIDLADKVAAWVNKYDEQAHSPYNSESFGGYSYTKSGGYVGDNSSQSTWQYAFKLELNKWRKI